MTINPVDDSAWTYEQIAEAFAALPAAIRKRLTRLVAGMAADGTLYRLHQRVVDLGWTPDHDQEERVMLLQKALAEHFAEVFAETDPEVAAEFAKLMTKPN